MASKWVISQYTPFISRLQPIYKPLTNFQGDPSGVSLPSILPSKIRSSIHGSVNTRNPRPVDWQAGQPAP